MDAACSRGLLRGQPFGGLAVFVRTLGKSVQCLSKTERLPAVMIRNTVFINVYFAVYGNSVSYENDVDHILSIIGSLVVENNTCSFVIGGDFNLEFSNGRCRCDRSRCDRVNKFMSSANLTLCDTCSDSKIEYTLSLIHI